MYYLKYFLYSYKHYYNALKTRVQKYYLKLRFQQYRIARSEEINKNKRKTIDTIFDNKLEALMPQEVKGNKYRICKTEADGNCLFHSLLQNNYSKLFERICNIIGSIVYDRYTLIAMLRVDLATLLSQIIDLHRNGISTPYQDILLSLPNFDNLIIAKKYIKDIETMGSYKTYASHIIPHLFSRRYGIPIDVITSYGHIEHIDHNQLKLNEQPLTVFLHRRHYSAIRCSNFMDLDKALPIDISPHINLLREIKEANFILADEQYRNSRKVQNANPSNRKNPNRKSKQLNPSIEKQTNNTFPLGV
jgi:hypothetical protein